MGNFFSLPPRKKRISKKMNESNEKTKTEQKNKLYFKYMILEHVFHTATQKGKTMFGKEYDYKCTRNQKGWKYFLRRFTRAVGRNIGFLPKASRNCYALAKQMYDIRKDKLFDLNEYNSFKGKETINLDDEIKNKIIAGTTKVDDSMIQKYFKQQEKPKVEEKNDEEDTLQSQQQVKPLVQVKSNIIDPTQVRVLSLEDVRKQHNIKIEKINELTLKDGEGSVKFNIYSIDNGLKMFEVEQNINIVFFKLTKNSENIYMYLQHEPKSNESSKQIYFQNIDDINLLLAQQEIEKLNKELNCKEYHLELNFAYLFQNAELYSGWGYINKLYLCLFKKNACISNIVLDYNGNHKTITISSYTFDDYQRKGFNRLLRAICIIIANKIDNQIQFIESHATSYISAHVLLKDYANTNTNVDIPNQLTKEEMKDQFDKTDGYLKILVPINEENISRARTIFNNFVSSFDCEKGSTRGGSKKYKKKKTYKVSRHTKHSIAGTSSHKRRKKRKLLRSRKGWGF